MMQGSGRSGFLYRGLSVVWWALVLTLDLRVEFF